MSSTRDFMEAIRDMRDDFSEGRELSRAHITCLFQCIDLLEEQRSFWERHAIALEALQREMIAQLKSLDGDSDTILGRLKGKAP